MERDELLRDKGYWIAKIQIDLFNQVKNYLEKNDLNRTQLAEQLGVTKGYISQVLNGDFDHRISKFVELALAIGKVPMIEFEDLEQFVQDDKENVTVTKLKVAENKPTLVYNINENTNESLTKVLELKPTYIKSKVVNL